MKSTPGTRWLWIVGWIGAACSGNAEIVVGRVPRENEAPGATGGAAGQEGASGGAAGESRGDPVAGAAGAAPRGDLACLDEPRRGPDDYYWCLVAQSESSAAWDSPPSPTEARVTATSPEFSYAGMVAYFTDPPTVENVGAHDQLVFDADVPNQEQFEVFIGQSSDIGCSYLLTGAGETEYVVDLRSPYWCWPSLCSNDLRATGVMFRTNWRFAVDTTLAVSRIAFRTESGPAGTVNGMNAGLGPGGHCWFAFAWDLGSASWVVPPSSGVAHVRASAPEDAAAGMGFQLRDGPTDLATFSRLEVDATVPTETEFSISAVGGETEAEPRGCGWDQVGAGTTTYVADLSDRSGCWGDPPFDLGTTTRVEFATPWAGAAELDMTVTAIRIVP